jgi:hypothetical protein
MPSHCAPFSPRMGQNRARAFAAPSRSHAGMAFPQHMKSAFKAAVPRSQPGAASRGSPYVSRTLTKGLLAGSANVRAERLAAADMLSISEAAEVANTDVAELRRWIADGRAIALEGPRRIVRLPRWQFLPALWDAIPRLADALDTKQGWALLAFLETPNGGLGGRTPRQALEAGESRSVLDAALAAGF